MNRRLVALGLALLALLSLASPAVAQDHLERRAQYVPVVYEAAGHYGQSGAEMVRVIDCETGMKWDPFIVSPTNDHGLAQFHLNPDGSTLMDQTPWAGHSLYDPHASIWAMAFLWSRGYQSHWACW